MPYKPLITDYKPFYIQTANAASAIDVLETYGVVVKSHPYPILPEPKDPYKNDLPDKNGDDEYVSAMAYKAREFTYTCAVVVDRPLSVTSMRACRTQIQAFFDAIKQGEFKIFDSYTDIGFQKVRFAGCPSEPEYYSLKTTHTRALFQIRLKANDPMTRMVLSGGSIVEETNS